MTIIKLQSDVDSVDTHAKDAIRLNQKLMFFGLVLTVSLILQPVRSSQTQRFMSTNAASMWVDEQGSSNMGDIPMRPRMPLVSL